jgi:hypothetical protein
MLVRNLVYVPFCHLHYVVHFTLPRNVVLRAQCQYDK